MDFAGTSGEFQYLCNLQLGKFTVDFSKLEPYADLNMLLIKYGG